MLKIQNNKDKLLILLFLYRRNININLPIIDIDVAVYGKKCKLFVSIKRKRLLNNLLLYLINYLLTNYSQLSLVFITSLYH
jgi:hypothetical protein